ncbi:uncharacterized protein LOC129573423, partial [Sitodiplosis mosellana]|uniref:uncharacterized protein LOC129573423 n=1 Tax=Sitodiplosis mosellana TaxID=263140 RepID=UPI00244532CD
MSIASGIEIIAKQSAFKKRLRSYTYKNVDYIDLLAFLKECQRIFVQQTKRLLNEIPNMKSHLILEAKFKRLICEDGENENDDTEQISAFYLQSKQQDISLTTNLENWFKTNVFDVVTTKVEELQENGSGWALHEIIGLDVNYNKLVRFSGSSYLETPKSIRNKRAVINVKNYDNQCFKWAILSALHPAKNNTDRLSNYERFKNELKFDGIMFPVKLNDICLFEQLNPGISVNVYIMQREYSVFAERKVNVIVPVRLAQNVQKNHVNLLLLCEQLEDENDNDDDEPMYTIDIKEFLDELTCTHYVWIKNLSALIQGQIGKNNNKKYICDRCLHYFYSNQKLQEHIQQCCLQNETKITLPDVDHRWIRFKNYKNKIAVPFIIYADIESLLVPITYGRDSNEDGAFKKRLPKGATHSHIPNSIGCYLHSLNEPDLSHYKCFSGKMCIDQFIFYLEHLMESIIWPKIHGNKRMMLTPQEQKDFNAASVCHICNEHFNNENNNKKVRDHCHLTGVYRGAAHSKCNMKYQVSKSVPVVFHNLDYDSHFLIEKLANLIEGRISIIPKNCEHYLAFTKDLDNFDNDDDDANGDSANYRDKPRLRFIDSYRFLQCSLAELAKSLPSDKLNITRKEWSNLCEKDFNLVTMKGIYPYSYMNSWESLQETQLPPIESFYDELKDNNISKKEYAHAKKVWKTFNIQTLQEYTEIYLKTDVLLLADIFENFRYNCIKLYELDPAHYFTLPGYSWDCMLKYTRAEIELFTDIDQLMFAERGLRGGICQCSHRYAKANHKFMVDDYDTEKPSNYLMYFDVNNLYGWAMSQPLPISNYSWYENNDELNDTDGIECKIRNTPDDADFGYFLEVDLEYPSELHNLHNDYPFCAEHMEVGDCKETKLVLTLRNKTNYVIHFRMLKLALKHGLKLAKVHRILEFKQSKWLNDYIALNTKERAKSKTEFEKNLYKLINNAIYGKSMENVRNRQNVVLEFDHHKCKILYTDTDSYVYSFACDDIYDWMRNHPDQFDTSGFPENNPYNIKLLNKKVVGLMKDEFSAYNANVKEKANLLEDVFDEDVIIYVDKSIGFCKPFNSNTDKLMRRENDTISGNIPFIDK